MALEFLFALWANHRAQSVLDAFIVHPQLYEAAGRPSDTYFVRDIYKLRYRFARFLQAHPAKPASLACSAADYQFVRKLAITMLRLEIGRGVLIVGLVVWDFCSIWH